MQNGDLMIESPSKSYGVKINISGKNPDGTDISGDVFRMQAGAEAGGFTTSPSNPANTCVGCSQSDASLLQVIYGGTGTAALQGQPGRRSGVLHARTQT